MSAETDAPSPFGALSFAERREVARALQRAEALDRARFTATTLVDEAHANNVATAARDGATGYARAEASDAEIVAIASRDQLVREVAEYDHLLFGDSTAARALGLYAEQLRAARNGDAAAFAGLRLAEDELREARAANAETNRAGRFAVYDAQGSTLAVHNSAADALDAAVGAGLERVTVHDRDRPHRHAVSVQRNGDTVVIRMADPTFDVAVAVERRSRDDTFARDAGSNAEENSLGRNAGNSVAPEVIASGVAARIYPSTFGTRYLSDGSRIIDRRQPDRLLLKDDGTALRSPRDFNSETVRLMLEIAIARQWTAVDLRGTASFRKAAWTAAVLKGVSVNGYTPTEAEAVWEKRQRERTPGGRPGSELANAFQAQTTPEARKAAALKHPELAKAFALEAAFFTLARRIEGDAAQRAFMARMRETIALDLAQGRAMADIRLRSPGFGARQTTRSAER